MSKQITLDYEGRKYTLTFTKRTVDNASQMGIIPDKVRDNPAILPKLFWAALWAKHEKITENKAWEMYQKQNPKSTLFTALFMLWNDVVNGFIEDDDTAPTTWEANFEIPTEEMMEEKALPEEE